MKRKLLQSNKGMSLTELVVSLAMMAIFIPVIITSVLQAMEFFSRTQEMSEMSVLASNIERTLVDEVSYAKNIDSTGDAALVLEKYGQKPVTISVDTVTRRNGEQTQVLTLNGEAVFDAGYYNRCSVKTLTFHTNSNGITCLLELEGQFSNYQTTFRLSTLYDD